MNYLKGSSEEFVGKKYEYKVLILLLAWMGREWGAGHPTGACLYRCEQSCRTVARNDNITTHTIMDSNLHQNDSWHV